MERGYDLKTQIAILEAWKDWYTKAIASVKDMVTDASLISEDILQSQNIIKAVTIKNINSLKN
jgi:aminopeptidase YwaD